MTELEKKLEQQVREDHAYVVALRRELHRHPELGKEEFETQRLIERELDAIGVAHHRAAVTGVQAEIKGMGVSDHPRTLLLRADIDALPIQEETNLPFASESAGKMHACGHDAHTAALIGTARLLQANRDLFGGTVRLVWQPGEEIGYGGREMVDEGCADGADRTFGLHISTSVPVGSVVTMAGPNNASVDYFKIRIHGRAAHVARPHQGVDAAYIASQIVVSAQAIVTRRTNPMENVLIGFGRIQAGTAYNVVAEEAELEGTIRVFLPEIRAQIKTELEALAKGIASLYGGSAEIEYKDNASPLINDLEATEEVRKTAVSLFGEDHVITQRKPDLTGDDMAEYILRVPGSYAYIGSANADNPNTSVAQHNSHFEIDEDCMRVAALLTTSYAVRYLRGEV